MGSVQRAEFKGIVAITGVASFSDGVSARSNFWGLSGSEDRGGGDNSIQFINIGRVGDKKFKE